MPNRPYHCSLEEVKKYRGSGKRGPISGLILDAGFIQYSWSSAGALGDAPSLWQNDQVTFIEEGVMEFRVGDEIFTAGPGEAVYLPARTVRQARSLTDTKKMEIFGMRFWERWEFAAHQLDHETEPG